MDYSIICVYAINGAREFLSAFLSWVFVRSVVDPLWVGQTKAWIIPQTEDDALYFFKSSS